MNAGLSLARFVLAFNVILFHIWNAAAPGAGPVAVLAFFYISGYLVTRIVQETYATTAQVGAFLLNRVLRIYPQYLGALLLGLAAIFLFPDTAYRIHTNLSWPGNAPDWIAQFAIFGLYGSDVRVLPAAWSLGTELYYYLVIGVLTGRSKRLAVLLFLASLPVGLLCALGILPFDFYGHPVGNGFAFAFGSITYFYRDGLTFSRRLFVIACVAYGLHTYALPFLFADGLDDANLAGSLVPFAVILVYLLHNDIRNAWVAAWANALGKAAYPMFLTHWTACIFVSRFVFGGRPNRESASLLQAGGYFLSVMAATLVLSGLFYQLIDRPVERFRRAIRRGKPAPGP